mgnify:CR=1 FL=1
MLRELALVAAILLPATEVQPDETTPSFQVIVNRSNPVSEIPRAEVSAMFMKRAKSWADGSEILPVDQTARSPLRAASTKRISSIFSRLTE